MVQPEDTQPERPSNLWKKPNEVNEASYICDPYLSPSDLPTQLQGQDSPVCGDAVCLHHVLWGEPPPAHQRRAGSRKAGRCVSRPATAASAQLASLPASEQRERAQIKHQTVLDLQSLQMETCTSLGQTTCWHQGKRSVKFGFSLFPFLPFVQKFLVVIHLKS